MVKWDAVDYARNSAAQLGWARELIGKLELAGSERGLDIGCGDGKVTAEIARLVPGGEVVGIDKSEEMVRFAAASFRRDEWPNLRFSRRNASHLGFHEAFDVVFSNATLHWMTDHRPVLRGIACALKPGGRALLQMGGCANAAEILSLMEQLCAEGRWSRYFSEFTQAYGFYGPAEYADWLPKAGLRAIRAELIPKDMAQQGSDGLAGWVRTTWLPYTQRVSEGMRDEFVNDVVDRYLERCPPDADGTVHVRMVRLEVEAIKPGRRSPVNGMWMMG
jgi:trans-aconitate 2-methyltransferase